MDGVIPFPSAVTDTYSIIHALFDSRRQNHTRRKRYAPAPYFALAPLGLSSFGCHASFQLVKSNANKESSIDEFDKEESDNIESSIEESSYDESTMEVCVFSVALC